MKRSAESSRWPSRPLGEIATIERDIVAAKEIPDGTMYVGLEHITSEGDFAGVATVNNGALASSKFRFSENHILYGKLRPYLAKIARPDFRGVCSTDILPILPGKEVDRAYLHHFLRQPCMIALASSRTSGANLPRISPKEVTSFGVPLPPLAEQKRIAAILDQADAIRRKQKAANDLAANLPTAIFYEHFGEPFADPDRWTISQMRHLVAIPPNYGTMAVPSDRQRGWVDLRVANIQNGELDLTDRKYVELTSEMVPRHEVLPGDLLLARAIGSIEHLGKCVIADPAGEKWAFDSHLMRVRFDTRKVEPRYVHAFLTTPSGRREFLRNARRSAVQFNINTKELAKIRIPLPPPSDQRRFVAALEKLDAVVKRRREASKAADSLFESLSYRAFDGKL